MLVVRLRLRIVFAVGAGVLVDRRGIGGWLGRVLLWLLSWTVYMPSERWRKNKARIHGDDGDRDGGNAIDEAERSVCWRAPEVGAQRRTFCFTSIFGVGLVKR